MEQHNDEQHSHTKDCGAMVIIRYPADQHQRCKNSLIKQLAIHHNYSDGEVQGIADHTACKATEGYWPEDKGIAFMSFESYPAALRWTYSVPEIKQHDWLGGIDMILVPCCEHQRIDHDVVQILDLDIRDHETLRACYSSAARELLEKHNARQVVSADVLRQGMKIKGQWDPSYLIINTWESEDCYYQAFNGEENKDILPTRMSSAYTNGCIATIEPLIPKRY